MVEPGIVVVPDQVYKIGSYDRSNNRLLTARVDLQSEIKRECIWEGLMKGNDYESLKAVSLMMLLLTSLILRRDYRNTDYARYWSTCRNLLNFIFAMQMRLMVPLMNKLGIGQYFSIMFDTDSDYIEFLAFEETLMAVFEVECLTHVCIERYVVAKYVTNGWPLQKKHYSMYLVLSLTFALLYSIPPLYGIGKYGDDFSCSSYTIDYILPKSWHRYVILAIFFLRSVKPVAFMITMLIWARVLEWSMTPNMQKRIDMHFTRMVVMLTGCNLTCWALMAWIRGKLLLNQFLYDDIVKPEPHFLLRATGLQECSPILSAIVILYFHYTRPRQLAPIAELNDGN